MKQLEIVEYDPVTGNVAFRVTEHGNNGFIHGPVKVTGLAAIEHAIRFSRGGEVQDRLRGELRVLKMTCEVAIAAGHTISLCDGEEWTVKRSSDVHQLVMAAMSTDMDTLRIHFADGREGFGDVAFVYGNAASEVINDYHVSLEELLEPVSEYCDKLSDRGL